MSWTKQPPYTGKIHQGCGSCPPVEEIADMDMVIAVGLGIAQVRKDDEVIFRESLNDDNWHKLSEFEAMAEQDPDHDWRVLLDAPLRSREYQRHESGKWVLIASGPGFA